MEIPDDRYYGIQTSRMVKVSGCAHLPVIFYPGMHRALFRIKKACALANAEIGALKPERGPLLMRRRSLVILESKVATSLTSPETVTKKSAFCRPSKRDAVGRTSSP